MKAKKSLPPKNFEAALEELEALSTRIESGALPLEEVLSFINAALFWLIIAERNWMRRVHKYVF